MRGLSVVFFIGSIISLIMGFNKMFVYESGEGLFAEPKNAHVGGDAYNYIINGTHSTAYFVLFGSLLIAGLLIEVILTIKNNCVSKMEDLRKVESSDESVDTM